ncbi:hypothetical protein UF64_16705 [Thalassospira sp. HJ]|uniref:GNAT family N-acetyltransferase n=1 Tax=Thalassospira sp. HJ TaxID=1616823 RepID=UPI0005CE35A2|nr:GNAT family N-acetyltransferase [Thalassospira sp. HJ]KJE34062.1 hypothetical protein UF64_16705 [Thalassospira sp. HJ]
MADSPNCRLAEHADQEIVREISAAAYIPAYQAVIGAVPKPAFEDYAERIEADLVWLAEITHQPVGVLVLAFPKHHAEIYSVAVLPEFQGRGVAAGLIELACEQSRLGGYASISLYTNTKMQANRRLYARCGFEETGTRPHPSHDGEFLVDMVRLLST